VFILIVAALNGIGACLSTIVDVLELPDEKLELILFVILNLFPEQ
jgi:hypothetical protein